jgi:cell division protein FtsL
VKQRPFLALWTAAVVATVTAFVVHLALRGRTVDFGYRLGRARAEQARLREVKRVLSLEAASYETPQRVEMVARTLLGMTPPPPERVIALRGPVPTAPPEEAPDEPVIPVSADAGAPASGDADAAPASADVGAATPGVILPRGRP